MSVKAFASKGGVQKPMCYATPSTPLPKPFNEVEKPKVEPVVEPVPEVLKEPKKKPGRPKKAAKEDN